jgi:hypothetical protein
MSEISETPVGRNEPCPCGSGKKYKRCHGVDAAPKVTPPKAMANGPSPAGVPGFDPSKVDPAAMAQMAQLVQRLPKGQLQKIQALMQKAMSGKDVTREAQELERSLPPEIVSQMAAFAPGMLGAAGIDPAELEKAEAEMAAGAGMNADEAKRIIEEAVKEGRLSPEEAAAALASAEGAQEEQKSNRWSKLLNPFKK